MIRKIGTLALVAMVLSVRSARAVPAVATFEAFTSSGQSSLIMGDGLDGNVYANDVKGVKCIFNVEGGTGDFLLDTNSPQAKDKIRPPRALQYAFPGSAVAGACGQPVNLGFQTQATYLSVGRYNPGDPSVYDTPANGVRRLARAWFQANSFVLHFGAPTTYGGIENQCSKPVTVTASLLPSGAKQWVIATIPGTTVAQAGDSTLLFVKGNPAGTWEMPFQIMVTLQ